MRSKQLEQYIGQVTKEFDDIPDDRKKILDQITSFIQSKKKDNRVISLILICTHNSRRSHLSQVWTQVAASYYGICHVNAYSGGTEGTALFPSAALALERAGIEIMKMSVSKNPIYAIKYDSTEHPIIGFSKRYDNEFNAQSGYAAIMTCSHADQNCPYIPEADARISLPFEDPKAYDNTPQQEAKYDERCKDIAREIFYAFSKV